MRTVLFTLGMLAGSAPAAQSQVDYYARLGVTVSTKLLRDAVVPIQEVEVRQGLAPTLVLGASVPFAPTYRAGLEASLTTGSYHSDELAVESDLGTLRTGSVLLNLEGPVARLVNWRAGLGLISYWPADEQGIFLRGGATRFLAGAGVDYRPRLMTNWDLMVSLRYDFHRFTTEELSARRFSGSQGVQRVSASVGLARARR
jgi:hypothetical protein